MKKVKRNRVNITQLLLQHVQSKRELTNVRLFKMLRTEIIQNIQNSKNKFCDMILYLYFEAMKTQSTCKSTINQVLTELDPAMMNVV